MTKKFSQSPGVWHNYATFLMQTRSSPTAARALLPRALQALPGHVHLATTQRFGSLEFQSKAGDAERGRTLFEGLLSTFPRRWDLWSVLLDAEISLLQKLDPIAEGGLQQQAQSAETVRHLFSRVTGSKGLRPKSARAFFKRWTAFEEGVASGPESSRKSRVEVVENRAREWVRRVKEVPSVGQEGGE